MSETTTDVSPEARALAVILARVRCEAIHAQTNDGRCVSCISWAERVGVPRHLARPRQGILPSDDDALARLVTERWSEVKEAVAGGSPLTLARVLLAAAAVERAS